MSELTNRLILTTPLFVLSVAGNGCATCIKGTTQSIPVSSSPSGANVHVDGAVQQVDAPCTLKLTRNRDHIVVVAKPGYHEETRHITRKPTGTTRGNIWWGGLLGWGVDAATGADNDLVPDEINVTLRPSNSAGYEQSTAANSPREQVWLSNDPVYAEDRP